MFKLRHAQLSSTNALPVHGSFTGHLSMNTDHGLKLYDLVAVPLVFVMHSSLVTGLIYVDKLIRP